MHLVKRLLLNIPKRKYFVAALLLRLLLAPFLSHPFDMRVFMAVGAAVSRGITPYGQYSLQDLFSSTPHPHLYGTSLGIGYPPLWGLISGGMYFLSSALAPNNLYAYVLALKIPVILGELALAVLIYKILKTHINERIASAAYLMFIFCPFIVSVGTIWGMFDTVALIFTLLSAYFLQKNWKFSAIFLSVSIILKVFPIVLAPLYSILIYKQLRSAKRAATFLSSTLAFAALFTFLPMLFFSWPVSNMYNAISYHFVTTNPSYDNAAAFPYGAASPFNLFALVNNIAGGTLQLPSAFAFIWIPALFFAYGFLFGFQLTQETSKVSLTSNFATTVQWSLLILLALFTTRVWVSDQNLVFLFTFFSLSVFIQCPQLWDKVELLWLLLFLFVLVHVPVISFFWIPVPGSLDAAVSFADGPFGWTRLLLMTTLTFTWLALCWHYVLRKLRWL